MKQLIDKMYNDVDGTKEYKDAKANMKPQKEERDIKVTNPTSGQSAMLTLSESIHYHMILAFEKRKEYKLMQQGLDKFSRLNPKAYRTLLD